MNELTPIVVPAPGFACQCGASNSLIRRPPYPFDLCHNCGTALHREPYVNVLGSGLQ